MIYTEESKEDKWITISHQHVLVGADGTIKAGLGGKFNGKPVQHAIDHLTSQKSSPKAKASSSKEKVDKPKSKMQHAHDIIKNASPDALAKDIKKQLADKLGISPAGASTYYHNIKKKLAAQTEKDSSPSSKKTYKDVVDKVEGSGSKAKQAEQIYNQMSGAAPKDVKAAFVNKIGMSPATASTYYFNLKKKFGGSSEVEKLVKAGVTKQDAEKIIQDAKKAGAKFKEDSKKSDLDHAMDIISSMKYDKGTTPGDIIGAVSKKLGISYTDALNIAVKANNVLLDKEAEEFKKKNADPQNHKMDQNEQELAALDIVKKMHKTHSPVDIHAEIAETLGIDYDKAYSLMKKAEKVVSKNQLDDVSAKPVKPITYEDMKNKVESSSGGAKIHHNHDQVTTIPDKEHVQKFKSRVQLAKKIDPHVDALDPHDHLIKVNSDFYFKAPDNHPAKVMTDAVYMYTGSSYSNINDKLRSAENLHGFIKDTVQALDKVFAHPSAKIKKETVVYRGYTSKIVNNLEPGDIFEDKGYMSTTSEEHKAESWAHSGGAVMHIVLPVGTNAISARPYSQFSSEHEVLLNRGAKIRIIEKVVKKGADHLADDQITFYAEYVVDKK